MVLSSLSNVRLTSLQLYTWCDQYNLVIFPERCQLGTQVSLR